MRVSTSTIDPAGITVAIVTGRRNEHCTYEEWRSLRNAFLSGKREWVRAEGVPPLDLGEFGRRHPYLGGEFGALLTGVFAGPPPPHHTGYQIRSLAFQTRLPDEVPCPTFCDMPRRTSDTEKS